MPALAFFVYFTREFTPAPDPLLLPLALCAAPAPDELDLPGASNTIGSSAGACWGGEIMAGISGVPRLLVGAEGSPMDCELLRTLAVGASGGR